MPRSTPQILIFCHHKIGTVLSRQIFGNFARVFGLKFASVYGLAASVDPAADIVVFGHSQIGFDLDRLDYRGLHFRRDPRDVWVSGYLYHQRCKEAWCLNTNLAPTPPIRAPQVPFSVQHRPDAWKTAYLQGLGGRSYQENLRRLPRPEGLRFELDRYAGWTIEAMADWQSRSAIHEMKLEDLSTDYDGTMLAAFRHLGFAGRALDIAMQIAAREDIGRMSDADIEKKQHIHSRQMSKWRTFLEADDLPLFNERYADVPGRLGYTA